MYKLMFSSNLLVINSIDFLISIILFFIMCFTFLFIYRRAIRKIKYEYDFLGKVKESVFQSLPIGVHVYDKYGILIDLNDSSMEALGISSRQRYLESKINLFENPFIPQQLKDAIVIGKQCKGNFQIDFSSPLIINRYISTINEGIKYFSGVGKQVIDKSGNILYYILIFTDITNQIKSLEELELIKVKAESSEKVKSAFIANMSHEIRTPLNSIVGFSELLVDGISENEEAKKEYMSIIRQNNELLLQLVNNVLNLSNIESEKIELNLAEHDLSILLAEWVDSAKRAFNGTDIEVLTEVGDAPQWIVTDSIRLKEVIASIINNAKKFTTKGNITIGYRWNKTHKSVYFFIRDTGVGILKEHIPHVFDRFYKVDSFIPGLGLGLTISKCIMKNLHGRIGVKSIIGKGSEFWFTLPCTS